MTKGTQNHPALVTNGTPGVLELNGEAGSIEFTDHFSLMRQLLVRCDSCLFVSPFLYREFGPLIDGLQLSKMRIELISSCAPRGQDQFDKPFSLRSFGQVCKAATGVWPEIGINDRLHSKIYIFARDNLPLAGVVTSANLTSAGLTRNHETGLVVTDESQLNKLITIARNGLEYVSLTEYQIDRLCNAADFILRRDGRGSEDVDLGLKNILNTYATPSAGNRDVRLSPTARYFVKVSGVKDRPILPQDRVPFAQPHRQLDFAKSPDRVRIGDCLLEVAVGGKCFLPYYACASAPVQRSEQEQAEDPDYRRWPYYVFANNMAIGYGSIWFEAPLFYDVVVEEFKRAHPKAPVTSAGGDHLMGAIQMGNSYFEVTPEFGKFVRAAIDAFKRDGG
jgi:hypothetical protein